MADLHNFQHGARVALTDLAQSMQLSGYMLESGNGVEQKNHLNRTIFTVYTDKLDVTNAGKIELAIGIDNIAEELHRPRSSVDDWCQSQLFSSFHTARSKSPEFWPRLALWSMMDVERFSQKLQELYSLAPVQETSSNTASLSVSSPSLLPVVDERLMCEIITRRGQDAFRKSLLLAYAGRCSISGCADIEVLEAAHITRHSETQDYRVSNGLLLRADLHTLFDLFLVSIDPKTGLIVVAPQLGDQYQMYCGKAAFFPKDLLQYPEPSAVLRHFQGWQAKHVVS